MGIARYFHTVISTSLILIALPSPSKLQAQEYADTSQTIEQQILKRPEPDINILMKSREALLEAVLKDDTQRMLQILEYMRTRLDSSKIMALWLGERFLMDYWTSNFEELLHVPLNPHDEEAAGRTRLAPQQDLFYETLVQHSRKNTRLLLARVSAADLLPYKKDFLDLFLKYLTGPSGDSQDEQRHFREELNRAADEYLRDHGNSEYNPFIREQIRFVVIPSPWGGGFEFALGRMHYAGALGNYFSNVTSLDLAFEGAYRNYYAQCRITLGFGSVVDRPFVYKGSWSKNLQLQPVTGILALGYIFSLGPSINFSPHAGIGFTEISPPEKERNKLGNDVSLDFTSFTAGINIDIPFNRSESIISYYNEQGSWYIRLRLGYHAPLTSVGFAKGSMFVVSLGVGGFARPLKRDL